MQVPHLPPPLPTSSAGFLLLLWKIVSIRICLWISICLHLHGCTVLVYPSIKTFSSTPRAACTPIPPMPPSGIKNYHTLYPCIPTCTEAPVSLTRSARASTIVRICSRRWSSFNIFLTILQEPRQSGLASWCGNCSSTRASSSSAIPRYEKCKVCRESERQIFLYIFHI